MYTCNAVKSFKRSPSTWDFIFAGFVGFLFFFFSIAKPIPILLQTCRMHIFQKSMGTVLSSLINDYPRPFQPGHSSPVVLKTVYRLIMKHKTKLVVTYEQGRCKAEHFTLRALYTSNPSDWFIPQHLYIFLCLPTDTHK